MMFRAAHCLRLRRCKNMGNGTVRPHKAFQRWLPNRSILIRRDGKQSALAFDHDRARFMQGCRNQRDPQTAVCLRGGADKFCGHAGFSKTAPGHDKPGTPIVLRRKLVGARPETPAIFIFP